MPVFKFKGMKTSLPIFREKNESLKKIYLLVISFLCISGVFADVIVIPATSGTNISADNAANSATPAFTVLGDIVIAESNVDDFAITGGTQTLILTAPGGWTFNPSAGTVSGAAAPDFSSISIAVSATTITLSFDVTAIANTDIITISGIEVQSTDGAMLPANGKLYQATANTGTATVTGLSSTSNTDGSGGTDFGSLSQIAGAAATLVFTTEPSLATVGAVFGQQPVVITQDQFGSATTNGLGAIENVTISLSSGTGTLSGTTVLNIGTSGGNGTVSFTDLQINTAGVKKLMATSGSLTFAVTNDFTVSQATTTTSLSSDNSPSCFGTNVTLTANISPILATGTVEFFEGANSLGTVSVVSAVATLTISSLPVGSLSLTAVYSGDTDYLTSTSPALGQVVNPAAPATPGAISGTATQCPGLTGQVYSITAVADATNYNWTVPSGWTITAGAGTISITVTTGTAGQNGNISVTAENSCGISEAGDLAVTVSPGTPATPGVISGTAAQCPGLTGQVYSIAAVPNATTYTWNVPTGWTITAGAGTVSITVTTGATGQNGNITVTAGNSCGTSGVRTLAVTVINGIPAVPGTITGAAALCPAVTGQVYSISAVPTATTYTWTVPTGWTITAGAGTTSITVTSGAFGQNGNITVTAGNSCGNSAAQTKAVTVNPGTPATPGTITGTAAQCPALTGQVYSIAAVTNATTYTWTVPTGWTITAGAGTISITVTTGAAGQNGNITVTAGNSCGTSAAQTKAVTVNPGTPATPGVITGSTSVCPGISLGYSIAAVTNATTYTWTVPAGWTITAGAGTTSITVTTGATGQNGNITVTAGNSCGTSAVRTLAVTVINGIPAVPGTITGAAALCPAVTGQVYSISAVPTATTYTWTVPTGWTITAGAGTTSITVTSGAAGQNGNITVTAGNSCGNSAAQTKAVTVNPGTPATPGTITGPSPVCPNASGLTYSIAAVSGATTYTWAVPAGWTINSGQGTISISATSGAAGGNITVSAGNSCGVSDAAQTINISPLNATNNTGWTDNNGPKTTDLITVNTGTEKRGYIKFPLSAIPAGVTITSSVLKLTNSGSAASGATNEINALGNNDPVPTAAATLYNAIASGANYNTAAWANTGLISLTLNATANTDIQTRIAAPGYLAVGLQRGGTAVYNFIGHSGGANAPVLTVNYVSTRSFAVTMNPAAPAMPGSITGSASVCPNVTGITYSISAVANATSYSWGVPTGWTITAGTGTTSITVTSGNTGQNGNISVTASNSCGTSPVRNLGVVVAARPTVSASPVSQTRCSGIAIGTITITNPNAVAGTTFSWTRTASGLTGMANSGSGSTINGTLNNATGVQQTTTFTITATAGSCSSSTTVTVTVDPNPVADAGPDQVICSGITIIGDLPAASGGTPGYGYLWTAGVSNTSIANPTAPAGTYTLTVTDSKGCQNSDAMTVSYGAVAKNWIGDGGSTDTGPDNNFHNPLNWSPAGVPDACNDVTMDIDITSIFSLGTAVVVPLSANTTIKSLNLQIGGFALLSLGATFRLDAGAHTLNILNNTIFNTDAGSFFAVPARGYISVGAGGVVNYAGNLTSTVSNSCTNFPLYATTNNSGKFYMKGNADLGGVGNDLGNKPAQVIFDGTGTQTITHNSGAQTIYMGVTSTEVGETNSPTVILTGPGTGFFRNIGDLNVKANATLDITANQVFNRNAAGGTINLAAGSFLKLGRNTGGIATSNFPSNYSTYNFNATSTVDYNGALSQTVTPLPLYGNLTLSNAGNKQPTASTTVQRNVTIQNAAILIGGTFTLTLGGNWTNYAQAGFNEQTSTVDFNGTGSQTINTTGGEIYYSLRKTASGTTTMLSDVAVQGGGTSSFTLSAGTFDAQTFTFNSAASPLNISAGLLKLAKNGASLLPEFAITPYNITGGTIELYGTGNQVLRGARDYRNLTFSTSGLKTVSSAIPNILGTALTRDAVVVDVTNNTFGGAGTNLTMTGTSLYKTAGTGTKPDAQGTYTLGTGTTIEFTNNALTTEDIRLTLPTYYNLIVSGSNVANPSAGTGIKFQPGATFTVKNAGIFKLGNTAGFSGGLTTSVDNTNSPGIVLENGSTVEYYGGPAGTNNQAITNVIPYSGLTFSGTSVKTAPAGIVTVNGHLTNTGSAFVHSNGTFLLSGTATQNYNSSGTTLSFYNVIAGNPVNVNINNDFNIVKQLSLSTSGKLNMVSGNITLKSDATNTANVDKILTNDAITYGTGNFVVERYIASGTNPGQHNKSWQFLAVPIHGSQTVKAAWQEGAATPNANPVPGFGTQITSNVSGATTAPVGFDVYTPTGGPSMKTYNPSTNAWDGIANTTSLPIANQKGYMVFVRGDRSVTAFNQAATSTIMRTTGKLFAPSITPANAPPVTNVLAGNFETIGNPYASAIDFTLVTKAPTVDDKFYVWDPLLTSNINGLGGYQTISAANGWMPIPGGTANYDASTVYQTIQSGQAFFVYSTATGGSVSFTEACKLNSNSMVFRPANTTNGIGDRQSLRLSLYNGNTSTSGLADGNLVAFDENFMNGFDANDALKISNTGENFGIRGAGKILALEARKPVVTEDTVFYSFGNLRRQLYQLRFKPDNMASSGMTAFLVDKFLNTTNAVDLNGPSTVDFTITTDVASASADRFYIIFKALAPVPVSITGISATRQRDASISVNWNIENETSMDRYELERSADGRNFDRIKTAVPTMNNGGSARYSHIDIDPLAGDNLYRVKALSRSGQVQYSAIVKVSPVKGNPGIGVYPNPVTGKVMNIQFSNQLSGNYQLQLTNKLGQIVYRSVITVNGSDMTRSVQLGEVIKGNYQLRIISPDGTNTVQQLIIE